LVNRHVIAKILWSDVDLAPLQRLAPGQHETTTCRKASDHAPHSEQNNKKRRIQNPFVGLPDCVLSAQYDCQSVNLSSAILQLDSRKFF